MTFDLVWFLVLPLAAALVGGYVGAWWRRR
jgi:hypothetical protein